MGIWHAHLDHSPGRVCQADKGSNKMDPLPSVGPWKEAALTIPHCADGVRGASVLHAQSRLHQDLHPRPLLAHPDIPPCPADHMDRTGCYRPLQPRRLPAPGDHLHPAAEAVGQQDIRHLPQRFGIVVSRRLHHCDRLCRICHAYPDIRQHDHTDAREGAPRRSVRPRLPVRTTSTLPDSHLSSFSDHTTERRQTGSASSRSFGSSSSPDWWIRSTSHGISSPSPTGTAPSSMSPSSVPAS